MSPEWLETTLKSNKKIKGFGHRVYKTFDPRARILAPIAEYLRKNNTEANKYFGIAKKLEEEINKTYAKDKSVFPNVDYYSGIIYGSLGIPDEMFTSIFAVSRTAGWAARVLEYLENNRIFRPRAMYTGTFETELKHINDR